MSVGEVVVLSRRHADDRVVLGNDRIVLARLAAEEAPKVIEAQSARPAVERSGRPLLVVGRQVPLAERRGVVAIALAGSSPRWRHSSARLRRSPASRRRIRRSCRSRRRGGSGRQSSAARVGEHSAVTWKRLYLRPRSASFVRFGVWHGPPNVDGLPNPASSTRMSSTLGASFGGVIGFGKSGLEPCNVRLATPANGASGMGRSCRFFAPPFASSAGKADSRPDAVK